MQFASAAFPFISVDFGQQPFGMRVRCVLDPVLVKARSHVTGLAVEATGGMEPFFGLGVFSRGLIGEVGQELAAALGRVDKYSGTSILYWGTRDGTGTQALGFRPAEQWKSSSFTRPADGFGKKSCLLPALKYFLEGTFWEAHSSKPDPALPGIFVYLLDGSLDDYAGVLDYLGAWANAVSAHCRRQDHLILVGIGDQFMEKCQGQIQALASLSAQAESPAISSLVLREGQNAALEVGAVMMTCLNTGKPGSVHDQKGRLVQEYADGLPGAFQFYLPAGSSSFTIKIEETLHHQSLGAGG